MTIDGRISDYNRNASATKTTPIIVLGTCTDGNSGSIRIDIPATFGETKVTDNFNSLRFTLFGIDNTNYYAGDGGISGGVIGSGKINILELSNDYVKGTFDFITGPDAITRVKKAVTNGEFYFKRE